MSVEADLTAEIGKWSKRLDESLSKARPADDSGAKMLQNIRAYRKDSEHFMERGDLVRSFECLIWAWAILELGRDFGSLKT